MPYKIRKARNQDLYYGISARNPREHLSKQPMTLERVKKQITAIGISERKKEDKMIDELIDEELKRHKKGGALSSQGVVNVGEYALSEATKKLKDVPILGEIAEPLTQYAPEIITQGVKKIFNIHDKLLPSAQLREQGIDIFQDKELIPPEDPRYKILIKNNINDDDQLLYQKYQEEVVDKGLSHYKENFKAFAQEYPYSATQEFSNKGRILAKLHGH